MMKYLVFAIAAGLIMVTFSMNAEAQILNRLKKKAQDAAERKAEEKLAEQVQQMAEQMVEKSWQSIFGEMNADSLNGGALPFSLNSNVKTEDAYTFDTITTMEIQSIPKYGQPEPPVTMDMHFNKNEMYTGTKFSSEEMKKDNGDLFIIYDLKNSAMIMLMGKDQDKFSFAYDWKQPLEAESLAKNQPEEEINWDKAENWHNYKKMGTKNILGYNCDGYRSENEKQVVDVWISRDADFGMSNLFKANANAKQLRGKIPEEYPEGMIMQMISEDLESGDKMIMNVTDIQNNARVSYAMADYPPINLKPKANQ